MCNSRQSPDLAVEILSPTNTRKEMKRKRHEYFAAGTQLVWEVEPLDQVVRVYLAPEEHVELTAEGTLDGGKVLPGLKIKIRDWFARASKGSSSKDVRAAQPKKNGRSKKSKE